MDEIKLNQTDDPFERSRKALKAIGLCDTTGRLEGSLAEVFMKYQKLDLEASIKTPF